MADKNEIDPIRGETCRNCGYLRSDHVAVTGGVDQPVVRVCPKQVFEHTRWYDK